MPGNISDLGDTAVRKTGKNHCPCGAYILVEETDNNKEKSVKYRLY